MALFHSISSRFVLVSTVFSCVYLEVYAATVSSAVAQTFLGIGGSGAWWPHDLYNFPQATRQNLSALLFSQDGLGISSYRWNIGGGGAYIVVRLKGIDTDIRINCRSQRFESCPST